MLDQTLFNTIKFCHVLFCLVLCFSILSNTYLLADKTHPKSYLSKYKIICKFLNSFITFFFKKINDIHSFKLIETSIQCKFAKNKKDESANKFTTSMLIA